MRVVERADVPALVIFDCDGVLVDSEEVSNIVLAQAISDAGWPMSVAESRAAFVGGTMEDMVAAVEARLGRPLPEAWLRDFETARDEAFRDSLEPVAGVRELLELLRSEGIDFCVASQGRPEKMALTLGVTGLLPFFEGRMFSAFGVARPKPFPDLFTYAAEQMGQTPSRCVVIEDTAIGVSAAIAADMRVLWYAPVPVKGDVDGRSIEVFEAMEQVPGMLGLSGASS